MSRGDQSRASVSELAAVTVQRRREEERRAEAEGSEQDLASSVGDDSVGEFVDDDVDAQSADGDAPRPFGFELSDYELEQQLVDERQESQFLLMKKELIYRFKGIAASKLDFQHTLFTQARREKHFGPSPPSIPPPAAYTFDARGPGEGDGKGEEEEDREGGARRARVARALRVLISEEEYDRSEPLMLLTNLNTATRCRVALQERLIREKELRLSNRMKQLVNST